MQYTVGARATTHMGLTELGRVSHARLTDWPDRGGGGDRETGSATAAALRSVAYTVTFSLLGLGGGGEVEEEDEDEDDDRRWTDGRTDHKSLHPLV